MSQAVHVEAQTYERAEVGSNNPAPRAPTSR